jgi:hypothetical protein
VKSCSISVGTVLIVVGVLCAHATADDLGLTRQHDPWGRFQPGAWSLVRVRTESFNGGSVLESVTETRTTLSSVEDDRVTLRVDVGVRIGGREIPRDPQTVQQGFHGELSNAKPKVSDHGEGEVLIENRPIPCRIQRLEFERPVGRKVTTIYYSDTVEPHILRQDTEVYAEDSEVPTSETTMQVVSVAARCRICRNFRNASRVKSVHKDASGTTTTWAWTSALVPGGVICYTTQQVDNAGRLVFHRELQLLDYGLQESSGRSGLFWRMRSRRGL